MATGKNKKGFISVIISILFLVLITVTEVLSFTVFSDPLTSKLLCRMVSRGLFGSLFLYHSAFLIFSKEPYFLSKNITGKYRRFCGVFIGLLAIGMIVTAFLGYGTNGDPRYIWWE